jgi:hypothetical protein
MGTMKDTTSSANSSVRCLERMIAAYQTTYPALQSVALIPNCGRASEIKPICSTEIFTQTVKS